eukprot:401392_1
MSTQTLYNAPELTRRSTPGNYQINAQNTAHALNLHQQLYKSADWKIEEDFEEEKYNGNTSNMIIMSHFKCSTDFISPQVDDYMNCDCEIQKCNAIQRIIHLLEHYKHSQYQLGLYNGNENKMILLYEYIMSLNKYSIPMFMEDWYHSKTHHFKSESEYQFFKSNKLVNCSKENSAKCIHVNRYETARAKERYNIKKEIDHKNLILADQIHSIHTFIFHSQSPSTRFCSQEVHYDSDEYCKHVTKEIDIKLEEKMQQISTNPQSLQECNVSQIICILNHKKTFNKLDKLLKYQNKIINYAKENELSGIKLSKMNRKDFLYQISDYINDKKMRGHLGQLYNNVISVDLNNVFVNNNYKNNSKETDIELEEPAQQFLASPKSLEECNVSHIICILHHKNTFNNLNKLLKYQNEIINCVKENEMTGVELNKMKRKDFIYQISDYINDKKMRGQLGQLYSNVISVDLSCVFANHLMDNIFSIQDCTVDHMLYILNHGNVFDKLDKLMSYKSGVINYIVENNLNGSKLIKMKRKGFLNAISAYLSNKKLKISLFNLYIIFNILLLIYTIKK